METPVEKLVIPITDSPLTMREVGIELRHINEKIGKIDSNQIRREDKESERFEEIKQRFDEINSNHVTQSEFTKHIKQDDDRDQRIRLLEKNSEKSREELTAAITLVKEGLQESINKLNVKMAWYGGGIAAFLGSIEIVIRILFKQ